MEGGSSPGGQANPGLPPESQAVALPPTDTMAVLGGESSAQDANLAASANPERGESESREYELEHTQKSPLTLIEAPLISPSPSVPDADPFRSEQAETVHGTSIQTTRPRSSVEAAVSQPTHATTDDASRLLPTAKSPVMISPQPVPQIPVSKEPTTSAELQPEAPPNPRRGGLLSQPQAPRKPRLAEDPRDGALLATDIYRAASPTPIQPAASPVPPRPPTQSRVALTVAGIKAHFKDQRGKEAGKTSDTEYVRPAERRTSRRPSETPRRARAQERLEAILGKEPQRQHNLDGLLIQPGDVDKSKPSAAPKEGSKEEVESGTASIHEPQKVRQPSRFKLFAECSKFRRSLLIS
jgi:hypothetical protein